MYHDCTICNHEITSLYYRTPQSYNSILTAKEFFLYLYSTILVYHFFINIISLIVIIICAINKLQCIAAENISKLSRVQHFLMKLLLGTVFRFVQNDNSRRLSLQNWQFRSSGNFVRWELGNLKLKFVFKLSVNSFKHLCVCAWLIKQSLCGVKDFFCLLKLLSDNLNTNYECLFILDSFHKQNMKLYENLLEFEKVTSHLSHSLTALSIMRGSSSNHTFKIRPHRTSTSWIFFLLIRFSTCGDPYLIVYRNQVRHVEDLHFEVVGRTWSARNW